MSAGARAVLHESSRRPWTGKVRPRGGSKTLLVSYRPLAIPGIIESGLQKQDIAAPMAKHRESNKAKPPAKKQRRAALEELQQKQREQQEKITAMRAKIAAMQDGASASK